MSALSIAIQIVVALMVIIALYIVTLAVLNVDSIVSGSLVTVKPKESSNVFDGYTTVSALYNKEFNTINQFANNFVKIPRSINTIGGAQFTYQFWVKINEADDTLFKNLPILVKGSKEKYRIGLYPVTSPNAKPSDKPSGQFGPDYYVRCPLIKFGDSWRHLVIQFNTSKSPMTQIDIKMNPDGGGNRRNILSLLPMNWYLLTFILMDNYSSLDSSENGIKFQFYINDVPYQSNTASTEAALKNNHLKQNDGNLYIFPKPITGGGDFMNIGNLTYYNYALTSDQVRKVFSAGPPTKIAQLNRYETNQPAYLTAYNTLDVYNY